MKRPIHIFALLLFALTQFVAPFAHAHVNGVQGGMSIHTSDIPHHLTFADLSHCHIESHESQAIDPQQEYPRDDVVVIPSASLLAVLSPIPDDTTFVAENYDPLHPATFAYHRPHPQAPPA
ncbi:MAG: hypothetical protein HZB95_11105 [Nitrosomonadales bacterium]|nr:hypothetical protein [Nitrosomonadales bacterium]